MGGLRCFRWLCSELLEMFYSVFNFMRNFFEFYTEDRASFLEEKKKILIWNEMHKKRLTPLKQAALF